MAVSLGIPGETLERLIQAAREFHAKEDVVFPDTGSEGSDDDWAPCRCWPTTPAT